MILIDINIILFLSETPKEKHESNGHTEEIPENSDCPPTKKLKLDNNSFPNKWVYFIFWYLSYP